MIKHLGGNGTQILLEILRKAWAEGKIPYDWEIGVLIPIYKKGDRLDCVTRGLFGWSKTTPARSFVAFGPNFLKIVDAGRAGNGTPLLYLI
jgi:hypothetical protein